jgi:hypothetical protein
MPSVLFWKCDCGIEWQALQGSERHITIYVCICGRRRTFNGKAAALFYAAAGKGIRAADWREVTAEKFEAQT